MPQNYRWAALHLRKACKDLVREVTKYRDSALKRRDFGKRQEWSRVDFDRFRSQTGVYLLSDVKGEPLFVGDCLDLGSRFERHSSSRARHMSIGSVSVVPQERLPSEFYRGPLKVKLAQDYGSRLNVDYFALRDSDA